MSLEQQYYELLTRTDHPVFKRDFSTVTTAESPFNSIINRVVAKMFVRLQAKHAEVVLNSFAHTVTATGIDAWEETFFGFQKFGVELEQRIEELLAKKNSKIRMSVPSVKAISLAITGQTPVVIRNLFHSGWVLDSNVLDLSTILPGSGDPDDLYTYIVIFSNPVDSALLDRLDDELTKIEKGGSKHILIAPPKFWILDQSVLGNDSIME